MSTTESSYAIDDAGWCRSARRAECSNFDPRPEDAQISLLVVHNISLPPGEFGGRHIEDFFANRLDCDAHPFFEQLRGLRVSAHFLIRRDGELLQFVSTRDRAWHAGASNFNGRERCNDFSIGIEMEGTDSDNYCDAQYATLAVVTAALLEAHPITNVCGHQHISPVRKTDPGPGFDWMHYRGALAALQNQDQLATFEAGQVVSFPI
ncbi:MAG: 1,6-anhydro-N-acetylmuramyl-L-alanine amidase AmpD [Oxalobacteraceae bacterium]|nr:1,6-anhydro-N-acetylmuramyl-L-alanine amidase AmpD [Oxalobacteraceae bacterium]